MVRFGTVLCFLALATGGVAQEVRMHVYYDGDEENSAILMTPAQVRFVWSTQTPRCGGTELMMRTADHEGRFTSSETSPFAGCASGQKFDAAVLPSGSFLVMNGGYVRVFDPSGTPLGPEFLVTGPLGGSDPHVAALGDRFVVTWGDFRPPVTRLKGRIVMEDGSTPYPERELPEDTSFHAYAQDLVGLASGEVVVAWTRNPVGQIVFQPYMRIFDATLTPVSGDIAIDPGSTYSYEPSVASLPAGFVVSWVEKEQTSTDSDIVARIFDNAGNPVSAKLQVPTSTVGNQLNTYCAADASGRFVVSWSMLDDSGDDGVYAQRLGPTGTKLGPEFRVNGTTFNTQIPVSRPAARADGSFIIPWYSYQDPDGSSGSFFRRYYFPISLLVAPGPGSSNAPMVRPIQPDGLDGKAAFPAYAAGGYGADVGAGDVDGDGIDEVLTGPGPSPVYGPQVRAFRPSSTPIQKISYFAYGTLRFGVRVAGGEIDGDGFSEILTGPGAGAVFGPHVRGWDFDGTTLRSIAKINFFSQGTLKWGAQVSSGDIDGDAVREILTSPGPGPSFAALVRAWNYDGGSLSSIAKVNFWAFAGSSRYGATVGAADVESDGLGTYGDGYQEIVAGIGPDPGFTGKAQLYDFDGGKVAFKYEIEPYQSYYGTNVAGGDIDAGDIEEVVTAPGRDPSAPAHVIIWEWDPVIGINPDGARLQKLGPDDFVWGSYTRGAHVAVGSFE